MEPLTFDKAEQMENCESLRTPNSGNGDVGQKANDVMVSGKGYYLFTKSAAQWPSIFNL
jgi:hypothetical protein